VTKFGLLTQEELHYFYDVSHASISRRRGMALRFSRLLRTPVYLKRPK